MATTEAGSGNGGGGSSTGRLQDFSNKPRQFFGKIRISTYGRVTYGGYSSETLPCGKCGCRFLNVGCPKIWPIGTVVLTCAMCGSVVEYVDGLLIMNVTEAIQNLQSRSWVIRHRMALELSEARGVDENIVLMALEQGLTMDEIVAALDIEDIQCTKNLTNVQNSASPVANKG